MKFKGFKTFFSIVLVALIGLGAKGKESGCGLELSDSKRAEILNSLLNAQPKLDAVYDLHTLAAFLKNPISNEDLLAPITAVESRVIGLPAKDLRRILQRLHKNLTNLLIAMRPELQDEEDLQAEAVFMAKGGVYQARASDLASKIKSTLESSRLSQAEQKYLSEVEFSQAQARTVYLTNLQQVLGAFFKTYRQEVQSVIESLARPR